MTHVAAKLGKETNLAKVVSSKNVNERDGDGRTPLIWAAMFGHRNCVEILVMNSADVNLCDDNSFSALMYSSRWGHFECLQFLIDSQADINQMSLTGETATILAATWGKIECLMRLLESGADISLHDKYGWSACHWAAQWGHLDCLCQLIFHGADINAVDDEGKTSLMLAAGSGHLACVRTFLESGAVSDVDQQDQDGRTALHHASYYGWFPSALFLIQAAVANPYLPDQSQRCAMDLIRIGFSDSEVEEIEAHMHWWHRRSFLLFTTALLSSSDSISHLGDRTRLLSLRRVLSSTDLVHFLALYC